MDAKIQKKRLKKLIKIKKYLFLDRNLFDPRSIFIAIWGGLGVVLLIFAAIILIKSKHDHTNMNFLILVPGFIILVVMTLRQPETWEEYIYKILLNYDPVNVEAFAKLKEKLKNNGPELSLIIEWVNFEYNAIVTETPTKKDCARERFIGSNK